MKSDKPKISVLMPVYNGEQFLDKSIRVFLIKHLIILNILL